jgi:predicted nucleotidyltransferase
VRGFNQLILFGSYSDGLPRKDSDFDIAVISADLENEGVLEKNRIILKGSTKGRF